MSLTKLPLLLLGALAVDRASTPPNSTPPPDERVNKKDRLEAFMVNWMPFVGKMVYWFPSIAEVTVILATRYPSNALSSYIIQILDPFNSRSLLRITSPFLIAWSMTIIGSCFRLWSYRTLGRYFTFELSLRKEHKLVTTGPYAIVRHPSYTGALLVAFGSMGSHLTPGSWARECGVFSVNGMLAFGSRVWWGLFVAAIAGIWGLLARRIQGEEKMMRDAFKKEWDGWVKRVPWRLVPGVL